MKICILSFVYVDLYFVSSFMFWLMMDDYNMMHAILIFAIYIILITVSVPYS